jgi:hypothetical protein
MRAIKKKSKDILIHMIEETELKEVVVIEEGEAVIEAEGVEKVEEAVPPKVARTEEVAMEGSMMMMIREELVRIERD